MITVCPDFIGINQLSLWSLSPWSLSLISPSGLSLTSPLLLSTYLRDFVEFVRSDHFITRKDYEEKLTEHELIYVQ